MGGSYLYLTTTVVDGINSVLKNNADRVGAKCYHREKSLCKAASMIATHI